MHREGTMRLGATGREQRQHVPEWARAHSTMRSADDERKESFNCIMCVFDFIDSIPMNASEPMCVPSLRRSMD